MKAQVWVGIEMHGEGLAYIVVFGDDESAWAWRNVDPKIRFLRGPQDVVGRLKVVLETRIADGPHIDLDEL